MTLDQAMLRATYVRTVPERDRYHNEHAILALADEVDRLTADIATAKSGEAYWKARWASEVDDLRAELADARDEIEALTIQRDSLQSHTLTTEQGAAVAAMAGEVDRLRALLVVVHNHAAGAERAYRDCAEEAWRLRAELAARPTVDEVAEWLRDPNEHDALPWPNADDLPAWLARRRADAPAQRQYSVR